MSFSSQRYIIIILLKLCSLFITNIYDLLHRQKMSTNVFLVTDFTAQLRSTFAGSLLFLSVKPTCLAEYAKAIINGNTKEKKQSKPKQKPKLVTINTKIQSQLMLMIGVAQWLFKITETSFDSRSLSSCRSLNV